MSGLELFCEIACPKKIEYSKENVSGGVPFISSLCNMG